VNFKLLLQYDGTDFHGWQIQPNQRTVQGEITRAVSLIEGKDVTVQGSGRTDAGVHAQGQVANVKLERSITAYKLRAAINGNIGKDVRVISVDEVDNSFHARYSAIEKTYVYRIVNDQIISPFWVRYAYQDARPLDKGQMTLASKHFIGEHDWTAFSAARCDSEDRVRNVTQLVVSERADDRSVSSIIEMKVSANGFLRYMVRSIVGTLMAVGRGELTLEDVTKAIETGVRPLEAATAPACGLTLLSVRY
jgi:tRNA pseudouridine38-40 synthase